MEDIKSEETQNLLRQNLEYTKACFQTLKKVERYLLWQKVLGVCKILLIIIPIVIAFIYLPSFLEKAFKPYLELLRETQRFQ